MTLYSTVALRLLPPPLIEVQSLPSSPLLISLQPLARRFLEPYIAAVFALPAECVRLTVLSTNGSHTDARITTQGDGTGSIPVPCLFPFSYFPDFLPPLCHATAESFNLPSACLPPIPMWGACCIKGSWFSSSDLELFLEGFAGSSTPAQHNGAFRYPLSYLLL